MIETDAHSLSFARLESFELAPLPHSPYCTVALTVVVTLILELAESVPATVNVSFPAVVAQVP